MHEFAGALRDRLAEVRRHAWVLLFATASCVRGVEPCERAQAGESLLCPVPGEVDRGFDLHVPASWDGVSPLPLLYAFHGGGGNRESAQRATCPGGDLNHPDCLVQKALESGYAIALPDGTGNRPLRNIRTWNAGGGVGELQCVSGGGCSANIDDMAYLDKVHAIIEDVIAVDSNRVFATGLSNGAAISHRLACERPERIAAIAPVGGTNQFAEAGGACPGGVHVLQVHGTEDPCWTYETSDEACAQLDGKVKIGVAESQEGWRIRNTCSADTETEDIDDSADDGTTSVRERWLDCSSSVELLRIEGGGHTWPQGYAYLGESTIGRVAQDYDLDDLILEFFDAHPK